MSFLLLLNSSLPLRKRELFPLRQSKKPCKSRVGEHHVVLFQMKEECIGWKKPLSALYSLQHQDRHHHHVSNHSNLSEKEEAMCHQRRRRRQHRLGEEQQQQHFGSRHQQYTTCTGKGAFFMRLRFRDIFRTPTHAWFGAWRQRRHTHTHTPL